MDFEKLVQEAGFTGTCVVSPGSKKLRRLATLVAKECARICEEVRDSAPNHVDWDSWLDSANKCADMIRAQVPPQSEASDK